MVYSVLTSETAQIITNNAFNVDTLPKTRRFEIQPVTAGNNRSFLKVVERINVLEFINKESANQAIKFTPMLSPPDQYVSNHLIFQTFDKTPSGTGP